jgi:hypothetical protein
VDRDRRPVAGVADAVDVSRRREPAHAASSGSPMPSAS